MTQCQDAKTVEVVGDAQHTTNHLVGSCTIRQTTSTHLNPARTQSQLLSLILHRDGCDRTILHPAVVLHRIAQHGNSHRGIFQELRTHILGISQLLQIHFIIYHHKLPGTLVLGCGRHQRCTQNQLQVLGIYLLVGELTMATAQLRQIFKTCHTLANFLCKDSDNLARITRISAKKSLLN